MTTRGSRGQVWLEGKRGWWESRVLWVVDAEAQLGSSKTGTPSHPALHKPPEESLPPLLPHPSLWAAGSDGGQWRCQANGPSAQEPRLLPSTLFLGGRPTGWMGPLYPPGLLVLRICALLFADTVACGQASRALTTGTLSQTGQRSK